MANKRGKFSPKILKDECKTSKGNYTIVTTVQDYGVFETEVYLNGRLIEKETESYRESDLGARGKDRFVDILLQTHQSFRRAYCRESKMNLAQKRKHNQKYFNRKTVVSSIVLASIVLLLYALSFIDEKSLIPLTTKENSYKKEVIRMHPETDRSSKKYKDANKTKKEAPVDIDILGKKQTLEQEEASHHVSFFETGTDNFAQKKSSIEKRNMKDLHFQKNTAKLKITVMPIGVLKLNASQKATIEFTNNFGFPIKVSLKQKLLKGNIHDEIVQFVNGKIAAFMEPGETKRLELFVEPTYYNQFVPGTYEGLLKFHVESDKPTESFSFFQVEKRFIVEVKQ